MSRSICAGGKRGRRHDRGAERNASAPGIVHERSRRAVRHLHTGNDHGGAVREREANTRRSEDRARRESLPLHRLLGDLPRDNEVARNAAARRSGKCGDGVSRTPMSELDLRRATTMTDALAILRDEKRTPIAGATDLYVAAQFGPLVPRKLLDIWAVKELRGISAKGETLVIGALATYTDLIRSKEVNERLPMLVEASKQVG